MTQACTIVAGGLQTAFATVTSLKQVLLGEPESITGDLPALYTRLERRVETKPGQVSAVHYYFLHQVHVLWQDSAQAEADLLELADLIPAAVWADAHLGVTAALVAIGRSDALVQSFDGEAGYIEELQQRALRFHSDILVK